MQKQHCVCEFIVLHQINILAYNLFGLINIESLLQLISVLSMKRVLYQGLSVQSGLEFGTFKFRIHSKTEHFKVRFWNGSVFERSEP